MISKNLKDSLLKFLKKNNEIDLLGAYLFYVEKKCKINPVLFPREKTIYKDLDELIETLEKQNKLWRETEIQISFGKESVNEQTKRIYI